MANQPDKPLKFPLPILPPDHEEVARPVISSQTASILESLHIQLGAYFSAHTNIERSPNLITAGKMVHEIIEATQTLGKPLPTLHHTYDNAQAIKTYDEEKYILWTGDPVDPRRHSKMLVILEYTYEERKIYQLMIIDTTTEDVGNHYKLFAEQIITEDVIDKVGEKTTRETELGFFESGSDQHVVTIFLDPDLFGSGGPGERIRRAA